ncbi:MAG: hypothetical protein H6585_06720 [Flavobacteriales bacterium]|nr:hypothetical protein [Flavobacteriales bacterium]MCB9448023.1 hypothetical protein [Flavobacteriales bacterium]
MIYLALSILFSTLFLLTFRFFSKPKVVSLHAITINYFTAFFMCCLLAPGATMHLPLNHTALTLHASSLGLLFIVVITLIPLTTKELGVSAVAIANKMSFAIPVAVAVLFYGDDVGGWKAWGLAAAVLAVLFSSFRQNERKKPAHAWAAALPLLLFTGSGSIDALLKYNLKHQMHGDHTLMLPFMAWLFLGAGCFGLLALFAKSRGALSVPSLVAGMSLGVINMGSIYFLMKALGQDTIPDSVIFPTNNVGVIALSTLASVLIWKDKLTTFAWLGFFTSLAAIALITLAG